jgi:hypothetical protein
MTPRGWLRDRPTLYSTHSSTSYALAACLPPPIVVSIIVSILAHLGVACFITDHVKGGYIFTRYDSIYQ